MSTSTHTHRGGARRGAGRPRMAEDQKRRQVYLSDQMVELARKLGRGNISEGIRRALALAQQTSRTSA